LQQLRDILERTGLKESRYEKKKKSPIFQQCSCGCILDKYGRCPRCSPKIKLRKGGEIK